jgi:hypothetical protein
VGAPRCSQRVEVAGVANEDVQHEVLPIPDRRYPGLITYDARDPDSSFAAISPSGRPKGRRMCCWCCWTTSGSARVAPLVGRVRCRQPSGWLARG